MKSLLNYCVVMTALLMIASLASCGKKTEEKPLPGGANVHFYETFTHDEMAQQIDSLIDAVSKQESEQAAQSLQIMKEGTALTGSTVLLCASESDTAFVNQMFAKYSKGILREDLKPAWTFKTARPYGNKFGLVALRTDESGQPGMTGKTITHVNVNDPQGNEYSISMRMNAEGAKEWARFTEANVGKHIAIVFDGKVYSDPMVRNRIDGGTTEITGSFTKQEAEDFTKAIKGEK